MLLQQQQFEQYLEKCRAHLDQVFSKCSDKGGGRKSFESPSPVLHPRLDNPPHTPLQSASASLIYWSMPCQGYRETRSLLPLQL